MPPTKLTPVMTMALELRDSLRDASKSVTSDGSMDADAELADRLFRELAAGAESGVWLSKSAVRDLMELRDRFTQLSSCDGDIRGWKFDDEIEVLTRLIDRFFAE